MIPVIRLIAYESREPAKVFVAVPDQRGRYVLTDRSVAVTACPLCKATVGEPCKSRLGYTGGTHSARRIVARGISHKPHAPDVVVPQDSREAEIDPIDDWPVLDKS